MKKILLILLALTLTLQAAPYGKIGKEIVEWFGRKGLKELGVKTVTGHTDDYLKAVRKLIREPLFGSLNKKMTGEFGEALVKHGDGCMPIFKRFITEPKIAINAIKNGGDEFVRTASKYSDEVVESISRRGPEHFKTISSLGNDVAEIGLKTNGDNGILKLSSIMGDPFFKKGIKTFDNDVIKYLAKTGRDGGKVVKHLGSDISAQVLKKTGREGLETLGKLSTNNVSTLKKALKTPKFAKYSDYFFKNSIKYGDQFLGVVGKHWKGIIAGTVVISILNEPAPWADAGKYLGGKILDKIGDIAAIAVEKGAGGFFETIQSLLKNNYYSVIGFLLLYLMIRKNKKGERFLFTLIKDTKDEVKKEKENKK